MFGNIKKKFNSAIQEGLALTENLQQQYRQKRSATKSPTVQERQISGSNNSLRSVFNTDQGVPSTVAFAGCSLLNKYERDWQEIHEDNEANAQRADAVANQIESIERRLQQQSIVLTNLNSCLLALPELSMKLQNSLQMLQQVEALTEVVEDKLERLQDLCEKCDLQEFSLHKQCKLSQYKQHKMVQLEAHRKKVALEHEQSIRAHEEHLRRIQSERQAVFDAAFRDDLEEYKQNGSLQKLEKPNASLALALEDVNLEDVETKDALEDFLNNG